MKPFIILGTGGHGEVVCRLLKDLKYPIEGVCDPIFKEVEKDKSWNNLKVFGSDNALFKLDASKYNIAIGLGVKTSENKKYKWQKNHSQNLSGSNKAYKPNKISKKTKFKNYETWKN